MDRGPRAIGVIMDGNRRWAKARGLPTLEGHKAGAEKIFELADWAHAAGVKEVILYTFSTENWQRTEEEVGYLMRLAEHLFTEELSRFEEAGVRVRFIGDLARASDRIQTVMQEAEARTKGGNEGHHRLRVLVRRAPRDPRGREPAAFGREGTGG